jgi:hypothetical protein
MLVEPSPPIRRRGLMVSAGRVGATGAGMSDASAGLVESRAEVVPPPYSTSTMSRPCAVNAQITVMAIAIIVIDQTG